MSSNVQTERVARDLAMVKVFEDAYAKRLEALLTEHANYAAEGTEDGARCAQGALRRHADLVKACGAELAVWQVASEFRGKLTEPQVRGAMARLVKAGVLTEVNQFGRGKRYMLTSCYRAQTKLENETADAEAREEHGGTSETLRAAAQAEIDKAIVALETLRQRLAELPDRKVERALRQVKRDAEELAEDFSPEGDR